MADSPILKIPLLSVSQSAKETTINTMVSYLERAMNDAKVVGMAGGNVTIPATDLSRYFMFRMTGVGSTSILTIPAMKRLFVIENLTNAFSIVLTCGTGTLTIPVGAVVVVYCDGTNLISVADSTVMGGGPPGVTTFIALLDTFSTYAGQAGKWVTVKDDEDGVETMERLLANLQDIDLTDLADGYIIAWNDTEQKFEAVPPPTNGGDAAVNTIKQACDVATIEPVIITTELAAGTLLDGVVLVEGMRVLVKDQTDAIENGIYVVTTDAAVRADDASLTDSFVYGSMVVVMGGVQGGQKIYTQTTDDVSGGITPGTTPLEFTITNMPFVRELRDVDLSDLAHDYGLRWNAGTQKWYSAPIDGGGSGGSPNIQINEQTASYTLVFDDRGKYIRMNVAGVNTVTVPTHADVAFDIGTQIVIRQAGLGKTTIAAAMGVGISTPETLNLRKQHSTATLVKVGTDSWDIVGDLELA